MTYFDISYLVKGYLHESSRAAARGLEAAPLFGWIARNVIVRQR